MALNEWKSISLRLLDEPHSFPLWQSLIHAAEIEIGSVDRTHNTFQLELLRKSYKTFLDKYPFAVNYWIAYARWEMKLGHCDLSESIFLEALLYAEYDLQLWVAYLRFKLETITDNVQALLELFEIARMKIGNHYHSFDFYSLYLSFLRTYATAENKFLKKSVLLLRIVMNIPLYSYAAVFKEIMDFLADPSTSLELLRHFASDVNLNEKNTKQSNRKQSVLDLLRSVVGDSYIVNQQKSLQLFEFEKELVNKSTSFHQENPASGEIETWISYLNFTEQMYPFCYATQLYERCLIANANNRLIADKFVDFILSRSKYAYAQNVLRRLISTSTGLNWLFLFIRLVDLELFLGRPTLARDIIVRHISNNSAIPDCIFEKLLDVEVLISGDNENRLCMLASEIIMTNNSSSLFKKILTLPISRSAMTTFFSQYLKNESSVSSNLKELKRNEGFVQGVRKYCNETDLNIVLAA